MIRFYKRKMISHQIKDDNRIKLKRDLLEYYHKECDLEMVIILFDNKGGLVGWTNYKFLQEIENFIVKDYIVADNIFWNNVKKYFVENLDIELLVIDPKGKPLSFCYDQQDHFEYYCLYDKIIKVMENYEGELPISLLDVYPGIKQVCFFGLNEFAWRIYQILKKNKVPVNVIGEEWKWFEVELFGLNNEYADYEIFYIFAEGRNFTKSKDKVLQEEFGFLEQWKNKNRAFFYKNEIEKIKKCGATICKVKIPIRQNLDLSNWTKNELLNILNPLPNPVTKICEDLERRHRQQDFWDSLAYERIKNGEVYNKGEWEIVLHNEVIGKKIQGICYKKRLYLIGPCIVASSHASIENSLIMKLQQLVDKYEYEVIGVFLSIERFDLVKTELKKIPIRKKDIVLCIEAEDNFIDDELDCLDLTELYSIPRKETWIYDGRPIHANGIAYKAIAKEIYDKYLREKCEELNYFKDNTWIQKGEVLSNKLQERLFKYVASVQVVSKEDQSDKKIGAIVMNGNPFTKGHLFLIETAASQVDFLYIFVVEEDKAFFSFDLRLELIKKGTAHLRNVAVVPSGNFIVSYMTMPVYFEKVERQEQKIDTSHDIEIFARYVAPKLGISYRFVGEEPIDPITRKYNEQMAEILPNFGIKFIEISRMKVSNGQIISASKVRKLMQEKNWDLIKELVPDTTYVYLWNLFSKTWGKKIVIYGAGHVGKITYKILKRMGYIITGWIDKNYRKFDEEIQIEPPEKLLNKEYDYIIVAVEKKEIFEEIKQNIMKQIGNMEGKIIHNSHY